MSASTTDDLLDLSGRLRLCIVPLARGMRRQSEGYTPTEASILGAVNTEGRISVSELANRERLSAAVVSRVVTKLVDDGLLSRSVDPDDRRLCMLQLTRRGRSWIGRVRHRRDTTMAARLADLAPSDVAALAAAMPVLEKLLAEC